MDATLLTHTELSKNRTVNGLAVAGLACPMFGPREAVAPDDVAEKGRQLPAFVATSHKPLKLNDL